MTTPQPAGHCEIQFIGHLDEPWVDWFAGLVFRHEADGTTTLFGPLADQAALYGVLNRLRDLGVYLLSVQYINRQKKA